MAVSVSQNREFSFLNALISSWSHIAGADTETRGVRLNCAFASFFVYFFDLFIQPGKFD